MKEIAPSFQILTKDIDESISYVLSPKDAVKDISYRKGIEIAKENPKSIVISADTIVVINNQIIGKPVDEKDAQKILKTLSNKEHEVITGFSIFYDDKSITEVVTTKVQFEKLSDELINEYIKTKSPLDKAGAYGIQDNQKFKLIKKITGSYNNVVGFPVEEIKERLLRLNFIQK